MLERSAPFERREACRHGGRGPKRCTAARIATPIAATASKSVACRRDGREIRVERVGKGGEVHTDALCERAERAQPVAHGEAVPTEAARDHAIAAAGDPRLERGSDHLDVVPAAKKRRIGEQDVRRVA